MVGTFVSRCCIWLYLLDKSTDDHLLYAVCADVDRAFPGAHLHYCRFLDRRAITRMALHRVRTLILGQYFVYLLNKAVALPGGRVCGAALYWRIRVEPTHV